MLPGVRPAAAGGAAQPAGAAMVPAATLVTPEDLRKVPRGSATVSRKQASIALQSLLHHFHGEKARGAVDITAGSGFDWLTWVAQLQDATEIIRDGVEKVYAVRWESGDTAEAVFCYHDGSFGKLPPSQASYKGRSRMGFEHVQQGNWRTDDLLLAGPVARQSYLNVRKHLWG